MVNVEIMPDGYLLVDRSKRPKNRSIIVAVYKKSQLVRRYNDRDVNIRLISECPKAIYIEVKEDNFFYVYGVVTNVINPL